MVFSSIEFLWFFLPAVLALYFVLPPRARNALLALVSLVFYAWGAHALVLLFLASIGELRRRGCSSRGARDRGDEDRARLVVRIAVVANVACLVFWKYAVFLVVQAGAVLGIVGSGDLPSGIAAADRHLLLHVPRRCRYVGRRLPRRGPAERSALDYGLHGVLPAARSPGRSSATTRSPTRSAAAAARAAARRHRRRASRASRSGSARRW